MTTQAGGKSGPESEEPTPDREQSEIAEAKALISGSAEAVATGLVIEGQNQEDGGSSLDFVDERQVADPFSSDFADFVQRERELRNQLASQVDEQLRADLLEKPYLMERPEEGAYRGIGAVWRSLRDQLDAGGEEKLDSSDREELTLLKRELKARKHLVEAVVKGIDKSLDAVEARLEKAARAADHAGKNGS